LPVVVRPRARPLSVLSVSPFFLAIVPSIWYGRSSRLAISYSGPRTPFFEPSWRTSDSSFLTHGHLRLCRPDFFVLGRCLNPLPFRCAPGEFLRVQLLALADCRAPQSSLVSRNFDEPQGTFFFCGLNSGNPTVRTPLFFFEYIQCFLPGQSSIIC